MTLAVPASPLQLEERERADGGWNDELRAVRTRREYEHHNLHDEQDDEEAHEECVLALARLRARCLDGLGRFTVWASPRVAGEQQGADTGKRKPGDAML